MPYTIEQLSHSFHEILKAEPGPAGRQKVCAMLAEALKDQSFISKHLTDDTAERHLLYEDPELGFCIFAHHYKGAKSSPPHDHGPSWAIYGQAVGETQMTDYQLLEPADENKAGKVRTTRSYTLKPGMAHVYNEHDLHSPTRLASTRLIRIEGVNMDKVKRLRFEKA
jgi:predicted metal-dependent enzyme (double-stranded beta helix superfamily)